MDVGSLIEPFLHNEISINYNCYLEIESNLQTYQELERNPGHKV